MLRNELRRTLRSQPQSSNAWLSTGSAYLAEALSHVGFDAVTVDLQHGMFGIDTAISLLQAISTGPAVPMVRCLDANPGTIGKLLDAGAYGVICPSVNSAEECSDFVEACRYPPLGKRSFGPSRALLYGGADYLEHADEEILTWAMVESAAALRNLNAIVATPGLDAIYLGPNDLSLSLGLPIVDAAWTDQLLEPLAQVIACAKSHDRAVGIYCASEQQIRQAQDLHVDLITPGNDLTLLRAEASRRLVWVTQRGDQQDGQVID